MASTYVPPIYQFNDSIPTSYYNDFAAAAGCGATSPTRKEHSSVFDCLVAADTNVLQNASGLVSTSSGYFGSFSWLPVIDHDMIQNRPSEQLQRGQISGQRVLIGVWSIPSITFITSIHLLFSFCNHFFHTVTLYTDNNFDRPMPTKVSHLQTPTSPPNPTLTPSYRPLSLISPPLIFLL